MEKTKDCEDYKGSERNMIYTFCNSAKKKKKRTYDEPHALADGENE
jgi:hypothetical protein